VANEVILVRGRPGAERLARDDCGAAEPYALMVLDDSMAPEFAAGDVIVVEPAGVARDGSFVVARVEGELALCQLARHRDGWRLRTLDGRPPVDLADPAGVHGVVIQKSRPGRRRSVRRYVD
jgi:SOS-response transcriptional repressor LexA